MLSDNHNTISNPSIPSSWSSMLYNILKHPPHSLAPQASSRTRLRHCSGNIWKHVISVSIYRDLASLSTTNCDNASATRTTRRRFVRLEHIGLSGVILYEIRMCPPCHFSQGDGVDVECLTMQSVFGDPDSSEATGDHSMNLDDLLDAVDAKMVHFPGYACTSFIVGQVMNAYLTNRPELTPIPAPSGFSILGSESLSVDCTAASFTSELGQCSDGNTSISIDGEPIQFFSSLDDLQEAFSLTEDDPYLALCVRTSSLGSSGIRLNDSISKSSDSEGAAGDAGDSTIDSFGPCTPPRLSHGLIPSGQRNVASKDFPGFVSDGLLHLTESFIDLTGSFFEDLEFAIINDRSA